MSRILQAIIVVGLFVAGACQAIPGSAAQVCAAQAQGYDGTVAGAFQTTVGAIRGLDPRQNVDRPGLSPEPIRWTGLAADHAAVICFIDADIPKGEAPAANGQSQDAFDRVVVAVVDGVAEVVEAGDRENIDVRAP